MIILRVEEFEFHQYFENEMDELRKDENGRDGNQEHAPVEEDTRESVEMPDNMVALNHPETKEQDEEIHRQQTAPMPDEMVEALLLEAEQHANELMSKAAKDASEIVNLARERAVDIEEEAKKRGYDAGFEAGRKVALEKVESEQRMILEARYDALLESLYAASLELEIKKEETINRYLKSLADLAITVAEKVINISLQSSGQVIERMILSTVETSSSHQWAKVRISAQDEALLKGSGIDLAEILHHVADRVKIVVIEDAPLGTCYVEFPDQIIDASVETQLKNIHEVAEELQL